MGIGHQGDGDSPQRAQRAQRGKRGRGFVGPRGLKPAALWVLRGWRHGLRDKPWHPEGEREETQRRRDEETKWGSDAGGGRFEGEDADAGVGVGAADGGGEGGVDGGGVLGRVGVDAAGHASGDVLGGGDPAPDAVGGGVGVDVVPGGFVGVDAGVEDPEEDHGPGDEVENVGEFFGAGGRHGDSVPKRVHQGKILAGGW